MRNIRQATVFLCRLARGSLPHVKNPGNGFTIVEVLIVLAVTGLLFVSAATVISGKQNQTAFNQAIQQIEGQIQQTMNEVSTGYYPNAANFQCSASAGGPTIVAGANSQGTNSGCIFVGKVMQFKVANTNPEQFETYAVAGLQQQGGSGPDVQSLLDAKPTVVPTSSVAGRLQSGLTTVRMTYKNGGPDVPIGAVAFTSSFATYSQGSIVSGSQQLNVVPVIPKVGNPGLGGTIAQGTQDINTDLVNADSLINPSGGVSICFKSGGTNQSALITIGGSSQPLAVTLAIKTGSVC